MSCSLQARGRVGGYAEGTLKTLQKASCFGSWSAKNPIGSQLIFAIRLFAYNPLFWVQNFTTRTPARIASSSRPSATRPLPPPSSPPESRSCTVSIFESILTSLRFGVKAAPRPAGHGGDPGPALPHLTGEWRATSPAASSSEISNLYRWPA